MSLDDASMMDTIELEQAMSRYTSEYTLMETRRLASRGSSLAIYGLFWLARRVAGENIAFDSPVMNVRWSDLTVEEYIPEDAETTEETEPDPTESETKSASRSKKS
ncbi:hypothetical protein [Actinopolyspora xinjiangensis]|uniref:hypothetical protein n=1 Tax=Actinopolyspora xinjiangensis TaxID=405564 RepID=UPI00147C48E3|nr:hypothetical protein [Actinopolyspora xinjiangensis]